jgi:hypothetical protein
VRAWTNRFAGMVPAAVLLLGTQAAPAPTTFRFNSSAQPQLHQLWAASRDAQAERVACLAATIDGNTVRITDVFPLDQPRSDSLAVSAGVSLETCGPPQWLGTVHTHVALRDGRQPYSVFSGADRGVMMMWWQRWRADGVFCLLYSEQDVICEIEGPEGAVFFPRSRY